MHDARFSRISLCTICVRKRYGVAFPKGKILHFSFSSYKDKLFKFYFDIEITTFAH